ncbi:RNA demethylase ALKBH9B isoform X2 [Rhodamnia argentea]|uniref:RNA demethylase ALKBH9B isoform X2 n=1 Tax=Rhodamnia argentea TaxID=178133 RepID=A0A8B8MU30_9MYRT|nr:RNA demethylase ALKBH9B isoform X2 [Rhodamnia argentea]
MDDGRSDSNDPFLRNYQQSDLRIASEFLTTWLPFLSRDLCSDCTKTLSDRIRSLDSVDGEAKFAKSEENPLSPNFKGEHGINENNINSSNLGESEDDEGETNSLGSWKDGAQECLESTPEASNSSLAHGSPAIETRSSHMSWADMAQEDELEEEDDQQSNKHSVDMNGSAEEFRVSAISEKPKLPREQRENIRFMNVTRKKDFICLERVDGKLVNILEGLELHTGVFSAAEQKRIVDYVYQLEDMGKRGDLKERTYTAPQKWMRGKGRVTIQFGCCYNYAMDRNGNPPGILQTEMVDPLPHLFKVIIRRLIRWHVLPPMCIPDSCIVNIYQEGDCIPPHIDNHDFIRPFCTVSFLSECDIVFGSKLKAIAAGEFAGSYAVPLPVGSVLVLNGNGADVAKHCVPAVPTKRISITFRRMDESKRPKDYVPEPDLQGIQPLQYEVERFKRSNSYKTDRYSRRYPARREAYNGSRGYMERNDPRSEPHYSIQVRRGPASRRRVRVIVDS